MALPLCHQLRVPPGVPVPQQPLGIPMPLCCCVAQIQPVEGPRHGEQRGTLCLPCCPVCPVTNTPKKAMLEVNTDNSPGCS